MSELAEGARLEIVCVVYSGTEGSNPSLSATLCLDFLLVSRPLMAAFAKSGPLPVTHCCTIGPGAL